MMKKRERPRRRRRWPAPARIARAQRRQAAGRQAHTSRHQATHHTSSHIITTHHHSRLFTFNDEQDWVLGRQAPHPSTAMVQLNWPSTMAVCPRPSFLPPAAAAAGSSCAAGAGIALPSITINGGHRQDSRHIMHAHIVHGLIQAAVGDDGSLGRFD